MYENKLKCVEGGGKWFDEPFQMCLYTTKGKSEMNAACDELMCVCESIIGVEENTQGERCVCFIRDRMQKKGEISIDKISTRTIWGG